MKPLMWLCLAFLCLSCGGSGGRDRNRTVIFFEANSEVWRVFPDGTGLTQVTNSGGNYEDPSVTRDGKMLVVQSTSDDRIVRMDSDGSNPVFLTSGPNDGDPNWAPDGSFIVFTRADDIWRMDPNGSNQVPLTTGGSSYEPAVSPNGSKIIYDDGQEMFVMNSDGSGKTQITFNAVADWQAQWSPNGDLIVFESLSGSNWEIFTMRPDGSERTQLTNLGTCWEAFFSPDGSQIAFCRRNQNEDLYTMNRNGSNVQIIVDLADYVTEPCWVNW